MAESFRGRWRITVTGKEAGFEQRFVISGSDASDGAYPGAVGTSVAADGRNGWQIQIQHNGGSGWENSLMRLAAPAILGVSMRWTIESEDLPDVEPKDWNDLVLKAEKIGPIIEAPVRPYAIEPRSLQMMPDGIFESSLGRYFMGVRITNIWAMKFKSGQFIDITPQSRALLAAQGVRIIDAWTQSELESFGQEMHGNGVVIGALEPFESRTIYFKVDCSGALPHKPAVEFICLEPNSMFDPNSPDRKTTSKIFITRSYLDPASHEMVAEAPEGSIRMALNEAIIDTISAKKGRRRKPKRSTPPPSIDELRSLLKDLIGGRRIDPCRIRKVIQCYCECRDLMRGDGDPRKPEDGRFVYDPFLVLPTRFTYSVECPPYEGMHGPIPFEDPWWKVLLLLLALILLLAGMLSEGSDLAYHDEDLIIGSLEDWRKDNLDVALTRLNDHRTLPSPFLQYLDAQSGEVSTVPVEPADSPTLGGEITITGDVMTKDEIRDIIAFGSRDEKRAFKSGGRTGLTIGLINDLASWTDPRGDGVRFDTEQVNFVRDPDNDMPISRKGDSGSVWIHKNSLKLVALNHSGSSDESGDSAWGSPIEDIVAELGVTFS